MPRITADPKNSRPVSLGEFIFAESRGARYARHDMIRLFVIAILLGSPAIMAGAQEAASPPTAAVAKKCRELAIKAFPPVRAGTKGGTAQAERQYFAQCLRKGGNFDTGNENKGDDTRE